MSVSKSKTDLLFVDSLFQESCDNLNKQNKSVKIDRVTGDASARRYYRVLTDDNNSYIACLNDPNGTLKTFFEIQSVFKKEKIRVPHIYDFIEDKGYMLLEDLSDQTLLKKLSSVTSISSEYEIYESIVDTMIDIHNIDDKKYLDYSFTKMSFDMPKYFQEVEFTLKFFIGNFFSYNLNDKEKKTIMDQFELICKPLVQQGFVVTHRDFHSRNIMCKDNEHVVIDFKDARMGITQYDLVSLLEDCYYSLNLDNLNNLKRYYWENFIKKNKKQTSYDEFLVLYDYMTIQRTFKAIGSFTYIYNLRNDERYLKYIGYSFEKLRKVLMKYDELKPLRLLLAKLYYEY
jgi:aminoglycoside/choline kinase family phosphotransferase